MRSADPSANAAISADLTFTTAGPEIEDGAGEETGPEPADAEDTIEPSPDDSIENPDMPDIPDTVTEADEATDGSADPADEEVEAGGGDGGCSCSLE